MPYEKMNMSQLIRQIWRLEWARDTSDDYKWAIEHEENRLYCIKLLLKRFS